MVDAIATTRMIPDTLSRILDAVGDGGRLLDVGGWAAPIKRADWVIDAMPYDTRAAFGYSVGSGPERYSAETWVRRDICDREPWPFEDNFFDFAVCVTTLEDVRDPVWVCDELSRVARAGYVEVPTILAELGYWIDGEGPLAR